MNAVYPLGTGSHWGNKEIEYSITFLRRYTSIVDVFTVGEAHPLATNIPYRETQHPAVNIWEKLLTACLDNRVSDPFLFINDDHYFTKPVDVEAYPNYYAYALKDYPFMREFIHSRATGQLVNPYYALVHRTYEILGDVLFFNVHCPCLVHKEKFIECFEKYRKEIYTDKGLLIKTTYLQGESGVLLSDYKIRLRESFESIIKVAAERHIISSGEFVDEQTAKALEYLTCLNDN